MRRIAMAVVVGYVPTAEGRAALRQAAQECRLRTTRLHIAQDDAADALLASDPFALLVGMLLDQQFPMERAFAGPYVLARRMGTDRLDPAAVASADPDAFAGIMAGPPAVHRYHTNM